MVRRCLLALTFFAGLAPAAHAQRVSAPAALLSLGGAWELVAINGERLPVAPRLGSEDPAVCDGLGEYVGERVGEGRLVVRPSEMIVGAWSEQWTGGVYAAVAEEVVCRGERGPVILRRDRDRRMRSARDVRAEWRGNGSAGFEEGTTTLAVADRHFAVSVSADQRMLRARDLQDNVWTFRRAESGPRFEPAGFYTLIGDFDGDGKADQVAVEPGSNGRATMNVHLATGAADVLDIPEGRVALARRGMSWRNADGTTLHLRDRDGVMVAVEPAPERSDVTVYQYTNGHWRSWEYSPD